MERIIIPPQPSTSMRLTNIVETAGSEDRMGSIIDQESTTVHHQESTMTPLTRREPIRVDYIKCKTPSSFARSKAIG